MKEMHVLLWISKWSKDYPREETKMYFTYWYFITKCNRLIEFVKKNMWDFNNARSVLLLYMVLILSILDIGSTIWSSM